MLENDCHGSLSDSPPPLFQITNDLLGRLTEDLILRRIADGTHYLEEHRELLTSFDPEQPNSPRLVGCIAQWVDTGWGDAAIVQKMLSRFSMAHRANLQLREYVHLRLAEGRVAAGEEETQKAIHHFDVNIVVGEEIADRYL